MREKINSEELKGSFTQEEKENLIKEMDQVMNWLYSNDEDLYNMHKLEEKSKKMKSLGDLFYSRLNGWDTIKENLTKMESLLYEKLDYFTKMEERIRKGENTGSSTFCWKREKPKPRFNPKNLFPILFSSYIKFNIIIFMLLV